MPNLSLTDTEALKQRRLKTCRRCTKDYIGKHVCPNKDIETEAEKVKRTGNY